MATAQKIASLQVDLLELQSQSSAVVRSLGQVDVNGQATEVAIHINSGAIEFRMRCDPPRVFKVNLQQLCERSLAMIRVSQASGEIELET